MNYEGNGDSVTVATDDSNDNENYIARESSPFKSLGSEDSKSRVCTLDLYTFLVRFSFFLLSFSSSSVFDSLSYIKS